jgi:phospholipase/carboxylesterase
MRKLPNIFIHPANQSITLSAKDPKCSLIWLHGLGDKAEGFMSFFTHSHSPLYSGLRIKMLQAPQRPVTLNNSAITNSWYDIKSLKRFTED